MSHLDDLKESVANNTAVVTLGTGFSSAVAKDSTIASWVGLLRAGTQYLADNGLVSDAIRENIENDIYLGATESGGLLLSAGQKICDQMQRPNSVHFSSFIDSTVGALRIDRQKAKLAYAVRDLGVPVLTTNYDTLYEQAVEKPSTTWKDARKFRSSAQGRTNEVVHLHGIWDDPDTIILTSRDYERIIQDVNTGALRSAIGALKSIIFVGYGAGLSDPHFENLWQWLAPLLPHGVKHFVLCKSADVQEINLANMERPIIAVPYGNDYSDLPEFIESLVPARGGFANTMDDPRTLARVAETCQLRILDQLIATSVMPWVIENREEDYGLDDLVIEPELFPLPPEQFVTERAAGNKDLKQLEPTTEVLNADALVFIGEEQSGVSTALAWAATLRAEKENATIPILLDYKQIGQGNHRVQNAVRTYLRRAGAPLNNRQPLPKGLVIAIDNVTAANDRDLTHTIEDLVKNLAPKLILIGCRPSVESWIQSKFSEAGSSVLPAYLGRLSREKTVQLARRADPDHAETLADRVLKIARKEGLTRSPLCLLLLIVGTVNDDAWIKAVSHTTFVDSFIDSLLGRGSYDDDMHLSIDSTGYSMVLELFSKKLIEDDSASASWADTISFIDDVVHRLDWSDNSSDILNRLMIKGLLVNREGQVQFRQHLYLHIFAARRCRSDQDLIEKLKLRPLYYASVLRHYAALQRDDIDLLRWTVGYAEELGTTQPASDGIFRTVDKDELQRPLRALERAKKSKDSEDGEQTASSAPHGTETGQGATAGAVKSGTESGDAPANEGEPSSPTGESLIVELDDYVALEPRRRSPFPAHDLDSAPLEVHLAPKLTLVSNILRDSELVQDADLKEKLLGHALRGWGLLMADLYASDEVEELVDKVIDSMMSAAAIPEERRGPLAQRFIELWSVVMASAAISEELVTIKLERAVSRIIASTTGAENIHLLLPAMMLTQQANDGRLSVPVKEFLLDHHDNAAVRAYVEFVLRMEYYMAQQGSRKSDELEEFISEFGVVHVEAIDQRNKLKALLVTRLRSLKKFADLPDELTEANSGADEVAS